MKKTIAILIFLVFAFTSIGFASTIVMTPSGSNTAGTTVSDAWGVGARRLTRTINFATALTEKGSALAANDIISVFDIPPQTAVIAANIHAHTAINSGATVCKLDLGWTSHPEADPDNFVDGYNAVTCTTDGVPIFAVQGYVTTATTLDMEIAELTGTLSSGKVTVTVLLFDMRE